MIQWILIILLFTCNFIFMNMKHPLAMGLMILIQTTLISLMSGIITKSFWFSYILFLIFLGGMLVMFIYVTSIASNEMFTLSIKLTLISIAILIMLMITIYNLDKSLSALFKPLEMLSITITNQYMMENSLSLNKLYNFPTNFLTIMLMIYLLITLIASVKITKLFKGPLRPSFN
nr:NADH dehydrogenase subunit 6 [Lophosia sp.]